MYIFLIILFYILPVHFFALFVTWYKFFILSLMNTGAASISSHTLVTKYNTLFAKY